MVHTASSGTPPIITNSITKCVNLNVTACDGMDTSTDNRGNSIVVGIILVTSVYFNNRCKCI